jgi:HK97 family phage prohead protease
MLPVNFECPVDVTKAYEDEGRWIVEGYAATSDFDLQDDIISEEAIRASAKDLLENSTVLHNHKPDEAIGRVLASRARKDGLFLKIMISKTASDIWQQVTEGVLNKFSVRGKVLEARKRWMPEIGKHARVILKMRLVEVSLVAVPANPKARAVRWYVEKALDEFEKAGGVIGGPEGGPTMGEGDMVEEELLEADGDADGRGEKRGGEGDEPRGFPPPDELGRQWSEHVEKAGLWGKTEDEVFDAWVDFCKQQGYPHPYPYPYPGAGGGARMREIVQLVDRLLAKIGTDENAEARRKLLAQVRALASGAAAAAGPNPRPAAPKKEDRADVEAGGAADGPAGAAAAGMEKAGRKISSARLTRLKKLLEELKSLIDEVETDAHGEKKADGASSAVKAPADAPTGAAGPVDGAQDRPADAEGMLARIAKALGVAGTKDGGPQAGNGDVPDLAGAVRELTKRIDDLENTPGSKTSLDEQDESTDQGRKGEGAGWKGLL